MSVNDPKADGEAASLWRPLLILRNSASVQGEAAGFATTSITILLKRVLGLRRLRNISAAVEKAESSTIITGWIPHDI